MYDVIIIGAGPSGLTAALYTARYRLSTLMFEKMAPGGQIILSPTIENFPGFPGGIATDELMKRFVKQIEPLGVKIESEEVKEVEFISKNCGHVFAVKTASNSFEARSLIVASGAHWKKLGLDSETRLTGRGVSYCGTCDAPLFRNKEVIVVGGGDKAVEEAVFLSSYASKVTLVHRRKELRAAQIIIEKAKSIPKINFMLDSVVEEITGQNKVEAAKIKNVKTNETKQVSCQGVFIFIGIEANTSFLKNHLKLDDKGFIITDEQMHASLSGVFACGDCRSKTLYQVINGCGEGAVAAYSAHNYLLKVRG